jgi:hypothetical protein
MTAITSGKKGTAEGGLITIIVVDGDGTAGCGLDG